MKLLILLGLFCSAYCSESQDEYKNEESRIAGGGNYGGFIGLTTYGGGPFLVKGKYERDNYEGFGPNRQDSGPDYDLRRGQSYGDGSQKYDDNYDRRQQDPVKEDSKDDDKDRKDNDSKNNRDYDGTYIGTAGYGDIQRSGEIRDGDKKNDDNLEYLGYRGGYGYCIGEYRDRDGYGNRYDDRDGYRQNRRRSNNSNYYDDETRDRCDYLYGFTGPTANDEPENLMRPCALDDWQCIRKYFAANGKCKPAYGPIPDPLYIDVNTVFYPVVNITVALPNLQVRGLSSAKISEFYVNKKTGNLVFAIDVMNLNETIPRAYFRYRRTAKESIVLADFATVNYRSITFTAVIPNVPNMRLDLADIHADVQDSAPQFFIGPGAYNSTGGVTFTAVIPKVPNMRLDLADVHPFIQDPAPPYFIGPGAYNSTDPDVITAFADFNTLYTFATRESLVFKSQLITSIYIQENICDFGLKLISV